MANLHNMVKVVKDFMLDTERRKIEAAERIKTELEAHQAQIRQSNEILILSLNLFAFVMF